MARNEYFPYYSGQALFFMIICFCLSLMITLPGIPLTRSIFTGTIPFEFEEGTTFIQIWSTWLIWILVVILGIVGLWNSLAPLIRHEVISDDSIPEKLKKITEVLGEYFDLQLVELNFVKGYGKTGYLVFQDAEIMIICLEDRYIFRIITSNQIFREGVMDFGSGRYLARRIKKALKKTDDKI